MTVTSPADEIVRGLSKQAARFLCDMAEKHDDDAVAQIMFGIAAVIDDAHVLDALVALVTVTSKVIDTAPSDVEGTACLDAFIAALRFGAIVK